MSRRRRRLFIAAGILVCLLLGAGVALLLWPRPTAITEENYDRIRVGMTLKDVEALLDGPPGRYGWPGERIVQTREDMPVPLPSGSDHLQWIDSEHIVGVLFDANHRVI